MEILWKTQKNDNLLKTKRILKLKYKLNGDPVFAFGLPVGQFAPLPPVSYAIATDSLKLINKIINV